MPPSNPISLANAILDNLARPYIRLFGARRSSFKVCGCIGLAAAVALTQALAIRRGLSPAVMLLVSAAAVAGFLAMLVLWKVLTDRETIVQYRDALAAGLASALALRLLRAPLLPYLELMAIGTGLFLAFGRIGCLMAGCCHGRPSRWGVRYGVTHEEHIGAWLVGVRLFPIQPLESLWLFAITTAGTAIAAGGAPAGEALGWFLTTYACGRFLCEFPRWHTEHVYLAGLSGTQWASVAILAALSWLEWRRVLPAHGWHTVAAFAVTVAAVVVAGARFRSTGHRRLLAPAHAREVAEMLRRFSPQVGVTSRGLRLSCGRLSSDNGTARHISLSLAHGHLTEREAIRLVNLAVALEGFGVCSADDAAAAHNSASIRLVAGQHGVYHLILPDALPRRDLRRGVSAAPSVEAVAAT